MTVSRVCGHGAQRWLIVNRQREIMAWSSSWVRYTERHAFSNVGSILTEMEIIGKTSILLYKGEWIKKFLIHTLTRCIFRIGHRGSFMLHWTNACAPCWGPCRTCVVITRNEFYSLLIGHVPCILPIALWEHSAYWTGYSLYNLQGRKKIQIQRRRIECK